jgi:formylglycine-generating enzyme required for sulfatase activity
MRVHIMSICLLMGVAALQSCRTSGLSTTKDIGGSPADVSKVSYVVFLTPADAKVHKGECPSTNMPVNRNCPGLKDLSQLSKADYEAGLRKAILATRPGGGPSIPGTPALVKTLEEKIARINAKLSAGGLTDAEKQALQSQRADLTRQLQSVTEAFLTADEQKRFDFIMQKLNASEDVTFDEGETNYQLAVAPLGGSALSMTFVKIPAGTFMMGSPDNEPGREYYEGPEHQVTISKGFEMQTTEVTQSQWVSVMGSNRSHFTKSENCPGEFTTINNIPLCPNNPVEMVSWNDAQGFISKLNAKADGYTYRLPTEAEWEYAARAGTTGAYAGDLDAMAWYEKNSGGMSHPVAKKQANAWRLFDMHGNVWEWTGDWFGYYSATSVTDPLGPRSGSHRVLRGGGWGITAQYCRSAVRYDGYSPGARFNFLGFRLLRTSP